MNKELLRQPFPPELIKQRDGHNGKMLSYVETHAVIARLNEGCDNWNFEIVEHHIHKNEVVVVGRLSAEGIIKMAFGGSAITTDRNGKVMSLADDLKAAASDALKKAASLLGVGLELYAGQGVASASPPQTTRPTLVRSQGRSNRGAEPVPLDRPSEKQIHAMQAICRRRNMSGEELADLIQKRTGKRSLDELSRREVSKLLDELNSASSAHR